MENRSPVIRFGITTNGRRSSYWCVRAGRNQPELERPGANLDGWPGKNADGTTFVGRIELAGGAGTCCVVALQAPLQPGQVELLGPATTSCARCGSGR